MTLIALIALVALVAVLTFAVGLYVGLGIATYEWDDSHE